MTRGWKKRLARIALGIGGVVVIGALSASAYAYAKASAFEESLAVVYDVPFPDLKRSADPAVIARGQHLAQSIAPCTSSHCHGGDLGGAHPSEIGPVGTFAAPNITGGGLGAAYSDGELARLIRHGVKKDGRSILFMPCDGMSWLPDDDVVAVISFVRSVPPVDRPNQGSQVGLLGKVLDRRGDFPLVMARRIDHASAGRSVPPAPTAEYGVYLASLCRGCHGPGLTGGPIPGGPPGMPVPKNLTPDATGLGAWSYEDFTRALEQGVSKDGRKLADLMPTSTFGKMNDVEKRALWAYLRSIPGKPFGGR